MQKAGLKGKYDFEAELPLPGGYADLVIKPVDGGRDHIVRGGVKISSIT